MDIRAKREKIREVIDSYTDDTCLCPEKKCKFDKGGCCISDEEAYNCLMERLAELDVVIKVDREKFTRQKSHLIAGLLGGFDVASYANGLEDGASIAVDPLIEKGGQGVSSKT